MFLANEEGNLDQKQMRILHDWTDSYKSERLEKVKDAYARNLVSRLLMKDPLKRPDASHVLTHPFLSGKNVAIMIGEKAEYDVFLSYRVNSDLHHCKLMYEMLTERGLRVWWDKKCQKPGVDWEEGFCEGLIKSRAFVPLLSRAGLQNFECLTQSSQSDSLLLEYRLALELQSFHILECVYPVLIGDSSGDSTDPRACTYTNYFKSGCAPKCPEVVVASVEQKVCAHLNKQGLGAPTASDCSVKDIFHSLTKYQGKLIEGAGGEAFGAVVDSIHSMIKSVGDPSGSMDTVTIPIKKSDWDNCQRELEMLRSCKNELDVLRSKNRSGGIVRGNYNIVGGNKKC